MTRGEKLELERIVVEYAERFGLTYRARAYFVRLTRNTNSQRVPAVGKTTLQTPQQSSEPLDKYDA